MHGHYIASGQQVVQDREYRFFHLAGITCASDDDDPSREIGCNASLRMRAIFARISLEFGYEDQGELRRVPGERGGIGTNKQLPREQRVPGLLRDHTYRKRVGGIGAAMTVLNEHVATLQIRQSLRIEAAKAFAR